MLRKINNLINILMGSLDVGSRLQTYFCARFFRNEEPIVKSKKGAVILVGGGDGHIDKAYGTACKGGRLHENAKDGIV